MSTFIATDPAGDEKYIGRWSRRLAPVLVELAGVAAGERVLDVDCACRRLADPATLDVGDALNLPYPDLNRTSK